MRAKPDGGSVHEIPRTCIRGRTIFLLDPNLIFFVSQRFSAHPDCRFQFPADS